MQTKFWTVLYFLVLLADISAIAAGLPDIRFVTKPLIMIVLGILCRVKTGGLQLRARHFIFAAVIFSWGGDVLLLFPQYFIAGLISFLAAHVLYTAFFTQLKPKPRPRPAEMIAGLLVAAYAATLVTWLAPHLGQLKPAVMVYAVVIAVMVLSALRAFGLRANRAGALCVGGAVLFVLSDSLLAVEKFHTAFPGSGIAVMLTYGVAQWMITEGGILRLKTVQAVK